MLFQPEPYIVKINTNITFSVKVESVKSRMVYSVHLVQIKWIFTGEDSPKLIRYIS